MLQDTTELNYSGQKDKQGVGPKKHKDERRLFLHPQLVISDSGVCLGVYDDYQWFRAELKTQEKSRKEINNDLLHKKHILNVLQDASHYPAEGSYGKTFA